MKTTRRSIPNDIFSVEDGSQFIRISTHRQDIVVEIGNNATYALKVEQYTFEQFFVALHGLLDSTWPSLPSEADKTPTAGSCAANSATQEGVQP